MRVSDQKQAHGTCKVSSGSCVQEREAAKVTHAMDGFVHKAFSVAYAASFDEVRLACRAIKHPTSHVATPILEYER